MAKHILQISLIFTFVMVLFNPFFLGKKRSIAAIVSMTVALLAFAFRGN